MVNPITCGDLLSLGLNFRIQRVSKLITQEEIANMAGVSVKDVESFENDSYIDSNTRDKLLRAYIIIRELRKPFY